MFLLLVISLTPCVLLLHIYHTIIHITALIRRLCRAYIT